MSEQQTRPYWAKIDRNDPSRIHLLEHHLADTGAVMEQLLEARNLRRATAHAGNLKLLEPDTAARLCVFAALHDIGKSNVRFQAKGLQNRGDGKFASHTKDMMPLLTQDQRNGDKFFEALTCINQAMDEWGETTVSSMWIAMLSHHGVPEKIDNGHGPSDDHWQPALGLKDPFEKIKEIDLLVRKWFPKAFEKNTTPLPENPLFQHHFLGLLQLADWIASDERNFPYERHTDTGYMEKRARPQARQALQRMRFGGENVKRKTDWSISTLLQQPDAKPNTMQKRMAETTSEEGEVTILESETGSGKTEAAMAHFLKLREEGKVDGMYFALPSRAAASQIHKRITRFVQNCMPDQELEPALAVPGYIQAGNQAGEMTERYHVHWEDEKDDGSRWSAESPKKFLSAQIAVGTIDQAMLSVMQTKHAHMRAACLSRNLLVIDEVHASDTYMTAIIRELVQNHTAKGGYSLLISATLGESARSAWLGRDNPVRLAEAEAVPYPCISTNRGTTPANPRAQQKKVRMESRPWMSKEGNTEIVKLALEAAEKKARTIIIRNTVTAAVNTFLELERIAGPDRQHLLLRVLGTPVPHHGRFAPPDRKTLDDSIEREFGRNSPNAGIIAVGTQTLEQSLDIDADLLITDICPADVLLQRIGRLHRHRKNSRPRGFGRPRCVVIVPEKDMHSYTNTPNPYGLGPRGFVYPDIVSLESTKRMIKDHPVWTIPKMNRFVVERATHPDARQAIINENEAKWNPSNTERIGENAAERQSAEAVLIDWEADFWQEQGDLHTVLWNTEVRAQTRLGEEGLRLKMEPAMPSGIDPHTKIHEVTIPAMYLKNLSPNQWENLPDKVRAERRKEGGFHFELAGQRFEYGRTGLLRSKTQ